MEEAKIRALLRAVADGTASVEDALLQWKEAPFEDLGFAKVDHHRGVRQGTGEVVYGAGKTPEQIREIALALRRRGQETVLIPRLTAEAAQILAPDLPMRYFAAGRIGVVGTLPEPDGFGTIVVATGGGVVKSPPAMKALAQNAGVVWLQASAEVIYRHTLGDDSRPLLEGENRLDRIRLLLEEREPLYRQFAQKTVVAEGPMKNTVSRIVTAWEEEQ